MKATIQSEVSGRELSQPDHATRTVRDARTDVGMFAPAELTAGNVLSLQRLAGNAAVTGMLTVQRTPAPADRWTELGKSLQRTPRGSRFYVIAEEVTAARLSQAEAVKAVELATTASEMEFGGTISGPEGSIALYPKGVEKQVFVKGGTVRAILIRSTGSVSYAQGNITPGPQNMLQGTRVLVERGSIYGSAGRRRVASGDVASGEIGGEAPKGPAGGGPSGSQRGTVSGRGVQSGEVISGEIGGAAPEMGGTTGGPVSEGLAVGGVAIAEGAAMLEFAVFNLVLPLLFDWMYEGLEADRRKAVEDAWKAAMPEIQGELLRHGVGKEPWGEFAAILQQTRGGRIIYANISCKIEPDAPPELAFYLVGLKLSMTNINRYEGDDHYLLSLPVYNPAALATELLSEVPDVV